MQTITAIVPDNQTIAIDTPEFSGSLVVKLAKPGSRVCLRLSGNAVETITSEPPAAAAQPAPAATPAPPAHE